ncbi:hypothetical protein MKW94_029359 [Papaver nudicaule]|uniref:Uncharacterized protein n=1 Tax=Papaver nudicaule TaxID=74823 RepID=A0AA41UWV2_PAPNU|nr:hypothetical protein [Papaver nudicaule]
MLKASSSFPSPCFRPSTITDDNDNDTHPPSSTAAPPQPISGKPNVTSCVYQTQELGLVSFTWYTNVIGRSLQIDFRLPNSNNEQQSTGTPCCFNLHIQPILFWRRKNGSKTFTLSNNNIKDSSLQINWNFSKAKFGSDHPEPKSGFSVSLVLDGVMILLVGDSYNKTKTEKTNNRLHQVLVLRREHVFASRFYSTKVKLGGKTRDVSIDCKIGDKDDREARLCFSIDGVEVIGIKRLKWKFRGNQKVVIDGKYPVNVSWDVYNWLFKSSSSSSSSSSSPPGHGVNGTNAAVFMFRFENPFEFENEDEEMIEDEKVKMVGCGFGVSKIGFKKRSGSSSMSSSMSPSVSSSSCSTTSSVMEWANMEETELDNTNRNGSPGFSLLIYAWKNQTLTH